MITPIEIVIVSWAMFLFYWAINWRNVKPTKEKSFDIAHFRGIGILVIIFIIIISRAFHLALPCQITWAGCHAHGSILFKSGILEFLGAAFSVIGVTIAIIGRRTLSDNWSSTTELKKGHELITRGIYSYVRHPIYSGLLLMMIGTFFIYLSIPEVLIFIIAFTVVFFRIKNEEELMIKTFPQEYPKYKKKVKALIPFVW